MKLTALIAVTTLAIQISAARADGSAPDVNALLASMTIEEKIGQMVQLDLMMVTDKRKSPIQLDPDKLREALVTHKVGSFINNGLNRALSIEEWTYVHQTIHDMIQAENPRPIPLLYGIDSIHGATYVLESTLFPQNIGLAATRNPDLARRTAEISAAETRAAGLRWTFAPVLDVGRQPLWTRLPETFGEDPHLASVFGVAVVQGFQGDSVGDPAHVAACMKHYVGYSFPQTGKDRSPALMPDWYLREYLLPPFQAAVDAGVRTVMLNSGEVNGVPAHGSRYLITEVLRGELGFQGVALSDWEDVKRLHTWHKIAETPAEAVRMALEAGLDMSMVPLDYSFFTLLKQLVAEGRVTETRIDESVRRILQLKVDVGLFDCPLIEPGTAAQFKRPEYRDVALEAAEQSMTLLKNQGALLPLPKTAKVLVTGPAARSVSALHGCWSFTWQGDDEKWYPKDTLSIADAVREKLGEANVRYHQGVTFKGKPTDADDAVKAAAEVDAVILCLGEEAYAETPGDINDLDLEAGQLVFAHRIAAAGKPVVLVLVEGRPRVISEIEPGAGAVLMTYWPGSQGARAVANVLFGDANPSGKLPFTYPRHANNLLTYDRKYTSLVAELSAPVNGRVNQSTPQYEFGHGLSYTTFEYRNLRLNAPVLKPDGALTVSVDVANTGTRAGTEVVELYSHDLYASLTPPLKRLRGFTRVTLKPGETRTVSFELSPADLAFVNGESQLVVEPGEFEIMVGGITVGLRYEE